MMAFAELLDRLVYTPGRNDKIRLLQAYFATTPDPDRGVALAALTDGLATRLPVRRTLLELMQRRCDPELFRMSRDYVGDTAETVALLWPEPDSATRQAIEPLRLADVAAEIRSMDRAGLADRLEAWLDRLDATGRWALLKLLTGALRVGVSARLARTAVAELGAPTVADIEEVWHGLEMPYLALFAWIEGRGPRPDGGGLPLFRPPMLAHPLEEGELATLDVSELMIEWKWDGIRVQLVATGGEARLYSRTGDDIGAGFPDVLQDADFEGALDGELLIVREGLVAPFNDLQQRLNRRQVSRRQLQAYPAHIRLYDALILDGDDLRALPLSERRRKLEAWHHRRPLPRTDLSPVLAVASHDQLQQLWSAAREEAIEGLMLKRRTSPYLPGRPKGHWYKWKRAPLSVDCVLMYAQRGSGKRSSLYSDYTFGVWAEDPAGQAVLMPVGKAYSGYSDAELLRLDRWVRDNTTERFGPVRAVAPGLVLEVLFDAVHPSTRHKSGLAMRFPRIARIRWDKPAADADRLANLAQLMQQSE